MTVCLGFENCSCHHMWLCDFRAERRHLDFVLLRDLHFLVWCVILYFEAKRTLLTTLFTTIIVYTVNRASSWNSHPTSTNQHSNYIVSANVRVSLSAGIHIKIFTFKFHCQKKGRYFRISKPIILRCQRYFCEQSNCPSTVVWEYHLHRKLTLPPLLPLWKNNITLFLNWKTLSSTHTHMLLLGVAYVNWECFTGDSGRQTKDI